jgi:hypothetical protein
MKAITNSAQRKGIIKTTKVTDIKSNEGGKE